MAASRFAAVVVLALLAVVAAQSIGGYGTEQPVTSDFVTLCEALKAQVQAQATHSFSTYVPVIYRAQLVNGVNYLAKVQVGPAAYVHVWFYVATDGTRTVKSVQENHTLTDALVPF